MPMETLGAIISVKPKQRERQRVFDVLDSSKDFFFPFAPDRSLLCPTGGDVDGVDGIGKLTEQGLPAVGDGIGLQESWFGFIPLVGFNGDLLPQLRQNSIRMRAFCFLEVFLYLKWMVSRYSILAPRLLTTPPFYRRLLAAL